MQLNAVELTGGPHQTGKKMRWMVETYFQDMAPWASLSFLEAFDLIRSLPFVFDPAVAETDVNGNTVMVVQELIKRPMWTMNRIGPGGDCDDKAICMASWARLHNYPYRFIGCGYAMAGMSTIPLTHVYTDIKIDNGWIHADCTYAFNQPGRLNRVYNRSEEL